MGEIKESEYIRKPISELKLWDKNPRKIQDKDFKRLKDQIVKLNVYKPLLIDQNNVVLGGNMRLRALKELGLKEVMCSVVTCEDEAQRVEYALSDNDRAGEYDKEQLAELALENKIDLELFKVDLGKAFSIKDVISEFTGEDDVPEPETDPDNIKSVRGEVYQLGEHRLMCGSSTERADVEKLMNGKLARMVFTDPPYMVNYKSAGGGSYNGGKYKHHNDGEIFNDNLNDEDALKFYRDVSANLYEFTSKDACVYWWYASRNQKINEEALKSAGWHVSQIIIWVKNGMVLGQGQLFHRAYEPCMVGWKKGNTSYKNKLVVNMKDVWNLSTSDFAELADVWYEHRDNMNDYEHPTQKPTALAARALKRSSQIGDLVVDLFGGSGSTLIACEQNNRKCYTMELDPAYCDVIRKRFARLQGEEEQWEAYTSSDAPSATEK
jgi:DNA modification methylase